MPKLSLTLPDAYGRSTKRVYGMETQVLLADYLTVIGTFLAALEAVTDLGMFRADLIIPIIGAEWDAQAGATVDVGATLSGRLDTEAPKKASFKIPGIKATLVSPDGTVPITGVVATLAAEFETDGDFNISDGEQVASWVKGTLDR